jgi:hypothetical protein
MKLTTHLRLAQSWRIMELYLHAISHNSWDCSIQESSRSFKTISWIHTTTRGAQICFLTVVLYGCNLSEGDINTLQMNSFHVTFCVHTKHVLRMRTCSTSKTLTSGYEIIFMVSANVRVKSAWTSRLGFIRRGWYRGPMSSIWHADCSKISRFSDKTVLTGLLDDVPLAVKQKLWFQHCEAAAQYKETVLQWFNSTYRR